jgi:hypothetical protein
MNPFILQEEHDYFQVLTKHNFIINKLVQEFYTTLYYTSNHPYIGGRGL